MMKKTQTSNYPLLESIVAQIQSNPHMSKITDFIQNAKQTLSSSRPDYDPCNKHAERKGDYFEAEYPWVKYCQGCALNLALCGKKIEKCLSSDQMVNKIKLCDTLNQISQAIKSSQTGHDEYSFLSSELQQSRQWFASILGQVDGLISHLSDIRNNLEEKVQQNINREIKEIYERQSLIVSKKIQLINEKSKIECGFVDLIGKENEEETLNIINQAQMIVSQAYNLFANQQYRAKLSQNVRTVEALFQQKLSEIRQLEMALPLNETKSLNQSMRMSIGFGQKAANYRNSKTEHTVTDEISYEQGKRLLTACSTAQHSGLITPCQMAGSSELNPLGELSQNRKMTRTALQLKARCRSRSGQKKVEVNVRENIQNAVKKKLV